jgi:glycosyltransferase involved in cell wall biosynthesis
MCATTTVITPVRNGGRYIACAIESALAQLGGDDELLVIDDGSTDRTPEIVRSFDDTRLRLIVSLRRGVSAARNTGLALATGEFVAFLDADDEWPRGRHTAMLAHLAESPVDAVFGRVRLKRESDAVNQHYQAADGQFVPYGQLGTGLFRHSVLKSVDGFAEDMTAAEDVDYYNRLNEAGMKLQLIDIDSLIYRRHAANVTNESAIVQQGLRDMLRRKLARARARKDNRLAAVEAAAVR